MVNQRGTILAIDQGTTNTKVLLVDARGAVIAQAARPLMQSYPHPAWVEQDADAIWQSVYEAIDECLAAVADPQLTAIAITNQRESVALWERDSGRPLGPVVVWQCRRTADFCEHHRDRRGWLEIIIDPSHNGCSSQIWNFWANSIKQGRNSCAMLSKPPPR